MMSKHLITAAFLAATVAFVPGAAFAADFSGSWVRDAKSSTVPGYPTYWLTRAQPGGFGGGNNQFVIEVQQTANSVKVSDTVHPARNYMLDGKPHGWKLDTMLAQATTTASSEGETLKVVTNQPYGSMPGNVTATETQTWSLSPDGKVLTIAMVRASPATSQSFKEVYNRK
jgi:hypothetical protein